MPHQCQTWVSRLIDQTQTCKRQQFSILGCCVSQLLTRKFTFQLYPHMLAHAVSHPGLTYPFERIGIVQQHWQITGLMRSRFRIPSHRVPVPLQHLTGCCIRGPEPRILGSLRCVGPQEAWQNIGALLVNQKP